MSDEHRQRAHKAWVTRRAKGRTPAKGVPKKDWDPHQKIKGVVGELIAELYIRHIAKWALRGREVRLKVEGARTGSNIDLLVQVNSEYRPIEVKCQKELGTPRAGTVLNLILNSTSPRAILKDEEIRLGKPILMTWGEPPVGWREAQKSGKLEVLRLSEMVRKLRETRGDNFESELRENISNLTNDLLTKSKDFS